MSGNQKELQVKVLRGIFVALCSLLGAVMGIFFTIGLNSVFGPDATTEFALQSVYIAAALGTICGFVYGLIFVEPSKRTD